MGMTRTDQQLYDLIERMETDLQELKRILSSPRQASRLGKRRGGKSLYGIFPRTRIHLADFRDARQSWSRHSENFR